MEQKRSILLIIFVAVVFTLFFIILPTVDEPPVAPKASSLADEEGYNRSQARALERVMDSYQYRNYGGTNLRLTQAVQDIGCGCWSFTYAFDVESPHAPQHLAAIEMTVEVSGDRVGNTTMTEIPKKG